MTSRVELSWGRAARGSGWPVLARAVAHLGTVELGRRCGACGSGEHGAPVVLERPDIGLSLSYADGAVLVAVASDAKAGVDVESEQAEVEGIGSVLLSRHERPTRDPDALRRIWVRKEAVLKALGVGLSRDMTTFAVSAAHEAPTVTWWADESRPVTLVDLGAEHGVPPGHVASLAVVGSDVSAVSVRLIDI